MRATYRSLPENQRFMEFSFAGKRKALSSHEGALRVTPTPL